MPALTGPRAALLAALVAAMTYANALGNRWAQDDLGVVRENPAAHSVTAAWGARFDPYWPPQDGVEAGLYRPAVTLSYGVDWQASGGHAWWFHATNVLLHAVATGLFVLVALAWLPPWGAFVAGVAFGVHPVHVEAVANVAGRADVMAAIGMLGAVLAARRYRSAHDARARAGWLAGVLGALIFGLLSKEHAVVTIAVLALDHWLAQERQPPTRTVPLYVAVGVVTLAWFVVWRQIAGMYAVPAVAAALRGLGPAQRLDTAVPVQLHVVRLLAWPFDLSAGYDPQVIPRRTAWSVVATVAALTTAALLLLAVRLRQRAPAVAFGILAGAVTLAPTANLVFASGITLAERTLYLAAAAPALAAGWLMARVSDTRHERGMQLAALLLLVAWVGRTVTRTPFWRDTRTVVVQDYLQHPENYRAHIRVARTFEELGQLRDALREYLWAQALFPEDPYQVDHIVRVARALGQPGLALRYAREGHARRPGNAALASLAADAELAMGHPDSAVALLRRTLVRSPASARAGARYVQVLSEIGAPAWELDLAAARQAVNEGRFVGASAALGRVKAALGRDSVTARLCFEIETMGSAIELLAPGLTPSLARAATDQQLPCARREPVVRWRR